MSDEKLLPCPRCGGGVKTYVDPFFLRCQNGLCAVYWGTLRMYESECVARDLTGNRAIQLDEDWLPSKDRESGLNQELEALVYLVRVETLRNVEQQLTRAIDGRNTEDYKDQGPLKAQIERDVLSSMRDWIRRLEILAKKRKEK